MATKARKRTAAENHLKAMEHPLRYDIWDLLLHRVMSPKELAETLDADLTHVAHHTKQLVKFGCAELVETKPVRGAVEHFYKATRRILVDARDWTTLYADDPRLAEHVVGRNTQLLFDDMTSAVASGTIFENDQFLVDRHRHIVDAQGQAEIMEAIDRFETGELLQIVERAMERRAKSDEPAVHLSVHFAAFKTPGGR